MHLTLSIALFTLLPFQGRQGRVRLPDVQPAPLGSSPARDVITRTLPIADLIGSDVLERQLQRVGQAEEKEAPAALKTYLRHRKNVRFAADALLQAIRKHAEPPFTEGYEVRLHELSSLVITATPEHVAWVAAFIDMQRTDNSIVMMRMVTCTLPLEAAMTFDLEGTSKLLSHTELLSFQTALETHPQTTLLSRPTIGVRVFASSVVETIQRQTYISDYKITRVFPDESECADPVISTLDAGTRWRIRPLRLAPGTYSLVVEFEQTRIEAMRQFETTLGGSVSSSLTITLPELSTQNLRAQLALDIGQGLVIRVPDSRAGEATFLLLELERTEELPKSEPSPWDKK